MPETANAFRGDRRFPHSVDLKTVATKYANNRIHSVTAILTKDLLERTIAILISLLRRKVNLCQVLNFLLATLFALQVFGEDGKRLHINVQGFRKTA